MEVIIKIANNSASFHTTFGLQPMTLFSLKLHSVNTENQSTKQREIDLEEHFGLKRKPVQDHPKKKKNQGLIFVRKFHWWLLIFKE
jgi:hypothetical protein